MSYFKRAHTVYFVHSSILVIKQVIFHSTLDIGADFCGFILCRDLFLRIRQVIFYWVFFFDFEVYFCVCLTAYEMSTPAVRRRHTDADKLVNRLKNSMPDKFRIMVQMHLSFILDLDGTKLEEMFTEPEKVEVIPKRKSTTPFSKKKGETTRNSGRMYTLCVMQ